MKQNMCVTIDEEIHSWLKRKNEMMSRLVNRILWKAMQKEIQTRALKSGEQTTLFRDRYCPACDTTQSGTETHCVNDNCVEKFFEIEAITGSNDHEGS